MATNMAKSWCVLRSSKNMIRFSMPLVRRMIEPRISCVCTEASATTNSDVGQSLKRKDFKRMKAVAYKKNRQDPEMERAARKGKLHIPLETVRQDWIAKNGFSTTRDLARHYGIFEHIFNEEEFTPTVRLTVTFEDSIQIHHGNFLTPTQATCQPTVDFECPDDSHWTLVLSNPDGNLIEKNKEFLHWMVGNIPGSSIADGEVLCEYLPPVPVQGTGFHRFVFCLLKQSGKLDLDKYHCTQTRDIARRTFSLAELLSQFKEKLVPAGLCFFQASWDDSVTQTFIDTLGMTEPMYQEKEFITPTRARKMAVREVFKSKYRNM